MEASKGRVGFGSVHVLDPLEELVWRPVLAVTVPHVSSVLFSWSTALAANTNGEDEGEEVNQKKRSQSYHRFALPEGTYT